MVYRLLLLHVLSAVNVRQIWLRSFFIFFTVGMDLVTMVPLIVKCFDPLAPTN